MSAFFEIAGRKIGPGYPPYIIAELSGNHNQDFGQAVQLVHAAKKASADAVKLQTYTADTITIDSDQEYFRVKGNTLWDGTTLYGLYTQAYTPWDWQPKLKALALELGMALFSTPFDATAVDFLEKMDVPAYKIASFELIDLPLIRLVAGKCKPLIMSTGMATLAEISEAVAAARDAGANEIALLKCNSAYPAPVSEMNLLTIPHLAAAFDCVTGLSDHTLGIAAAVASVALGGCIIEKHFTLSRAQPGPDAAFSLEPHEFKAMADAAHEAWQALGKVNYAPTSQEEKSRVFRRSLLSSRMSNRASPLLRRMCAPSVRGTACRRSSCPRSSVAAPRRISPAAPPSAGPSSPERLAELSLV